MVQVHHNEGVAIHIGLESCAGHREASGEALTEERAGQLPSGERTLIRGADVVGATEGNTAKTASARFWLAPRRLRPWHVRTSPAREPGDLHHCPGSRIQGRIRKAGGRSR